MRDLVVAGGGPAGLATAIHAARAGMRVTVVEPRQGVVDKACGEGLMPPGAAALTRLGVQPTGHPLGGIRYVDGAHRAEARFRAGRGVGMRRTALHAALSAVADSVGVERVHGRVTDLSQDEDTVSADTGTAGPLRGRWLVAADGLHSPVRRALGLDAPPAGHRRYGLRAHHTVAPWTDLVEVHWTPDAEAYVTPVAVDTVGVAVLFTRPQPGVDRPVGGRLGYASWLDTFPALAHRLGGARPVGDVAGAGPFHQRARRRVAGRVLLVGDAAGYVDALTGEGLSLAFAAAESAVRCLVDGDPGRYAREWGRLTRRYRALTGALLAARRRPVLRARLVPTAARAPVLFEQVVHLLASETRAGPRAALTPTATP